MYHSRGLRMDYLPTELLDQIFGEFGYEDWKRFRLVCKTFANVCAKYLTHTCTFSTTKDGLRKLEHMSMHPAFSTCIDMLIFDCSLLINFSDEHDFHSRLRFCNESPEQSQRQFITYRPLLEAQNTIISTEEDANIFEAAIPRFSKLQALRIYMGSLEIGGRQQKEDFARISTHVPYYAIRQSASCSIRQFMMLMDILFRHNIRVSVLEVGPLTFSVFRQNLDLVQNVFSSLKQLVFYVSALEDMPWPQQPPLTFFGSQSFCDVIGNGRALNLLSAASQLAHLSVSVEYSPSGKDANFKDLFGNHTWPCLKRLSIGYMSASETDLVDFLRRHKLKELSIRSINLQGSWITALPAMREAASPSLSSALAYEWITNDTNETWYLGRHPSKPVVGRGDESSLGLHVAYYLTGAPSDFPCPLTLDNMS